MTTPTSISPHFPFQSHYAEILGSRMHFVDEGSGDPIFFLHGNPESSYIWRNIIPHLAPFGRCLAPDLIGFGRSDKPDIEYRFFDHVRYTEAFINELGLKDITLVLHDWGSALGFHYATRNAGNIKGLAFMEPILMPVPSWDVFPADFREVFQSFRTPGLGWDLLVNQNAFIEQVLPGGVVRRLSEEELDHYREPFKVAGSRKPLWRFPNEIPIEGQPSDVAEAVTGYNQWLQQTELPKLLFFASPGAIMPAPMVEWCKENLKNLKTVDIGPGIHFLQEDNPGLIGEKLATWYQDL